MKKQLMVILGVLLAVSVCVGTASAATTPVPSSSRTLNVDFGYAGQNIYSGLRAAPDDPAHTFWNGLGFLGDSGLLYSDGSLSGISVATTASQAYEDGSSDKLLQDRIFKANTWTAFDVTISGVSAGAYDLYVYGSHANYGSTYTVGALTDYARIGVKDFALLRVSPVNGEIVINVDRYNTSGYTSAAAVIGGFQLQPVPVPAALLLFGTGLAGLLGLRRRKD